MMKIRIISIKISKVISEANKEKNIWEQLSKFGSIRKSRLAGLEKRK